MLDDPSFLFGQDRALGVPRLEVGARILAHPSAAPRLPTEVVAPPSPAVPLPWWRRAIAWLRDHWASLYCYWR